MHHTKTLFLIAATLIVTLSAQTIAPVWTDWELANSIVKEEYWLVIRQPDAGFCYIKQGYDESPDKMDLLMKKDGIPYLTTPFCRGIQGDVSYWVDDGPVRIIHEKNVSALGMKLSPDIIPELKKGKFLIVRVKPVGMSTTKQKFNLRGFTAASKWLGSSTCGK